MRIPHTIPKILLRAFTRKLDEEGLKKSYEGRTLISEDTTWDKEVSPTLAQQCLTLVTDEFLFFDKFLEYFNDLKLQDYEKRRAQWEKDLAEYLEKRKIYEKKLADYERKMKYGIQDGDMDDDDDDDDLANPQLGPRKPVEPEKVEDEFPEYEPIHSVLDHLKDDDRIQVVEDIELDLVPFPLAVKIIPDDFYWERLARERWTVFDITEHDKCWRRMYMEKHAWDAIERFHPADDDLEKLKEDLEIVGLEVLRLKLQNLIPICFGTPAKAIEPKVFEGDNEWGPDPEFDEGFGDNDMFEDPDDEGIEVNESVVKQFTKKQGQKKGNKNNAVKSGLEKDYIVPAEKRNPDLDRQDPSHIDFSLIFPIFKNLKELYVVYEMVETGLDWEERLFQFTDTDCLNLAKAVAESPVLEKIEILRSHMTGEQCKTLVREGLIKMSHLKHLSLNYNRIGDAGARAIARLLMDEQSKVPHTLHTLRVARNRIHNKGGKALAYALTRNRHLAILDARLNSFGDPAGMDFGHALVKNTSLVAIFLGANKMTEESAYVFGKMLFHNKRLREMDVSSNDLGKKGGEYLALGMRNNRSILRLDVRCSNIGLDFEYDLGIHLRKNRNRMSQHHSIVDSEDYLPPDAESVLFDLEEEETEESDEEAGEEEMEDEEEEDEEEEGEGDEDDEGIMAMIRKPPQEKSIDGITVESLRRADIPGLGDPEVAINDPKIVAIICKAIGADPALYVPGYKGKDKDKGKDKKAAETNKKEVNKGKVKAEKGRRKAPAPAPAPTQDPVPTQDPASTQDTAAPTQDPNEWKVVKQPAEMRKSEHTLV